MTMPRQMMLPSVMIALSLAAAIVSFVSGDWRRGGYWLAAAAITFFVTI
jgi:hypothetical protein